MLGGSASRQRADMLDAKVEALESGLEELRMQALGRKLDTLVASMAQMGARLDHVVADLDRVTTNVDRAWRQIDRQGAGQRQQTIQTTAMLDTIERLRAEGRLAGEAAEGQRSSLDELREHGAEQGRSLDRIRTDIARIERQAAADLAELRATSTALARRVLDADRRRDGAAS